MIPKLLFVWILTNLVIEQVFCRPGPDCGDHGVGGGKGDDNGPSGGNDGVSVYNDTYICRVPTYSCVQAAAKQSENRPFKISNRLSEHIVSGVEFLIFIF